MSMTVHDSFMPHDAAMIQSNSEKSVNDRYIYLSCRPEDPKPVRKASLEKLNL